MNHDNALIHFSNSDDQLVRNREKEVSTPSSESNDAKVKIEIPEDAFLMVTQMNWEDDVVWNGEDIKHKVSYNSPEPFGG